jgi:hypothetical protein
MQYWFVGLPYADVTRPYSVFPGTDLVEGVWC